MYDRTVERPGLRGSYRDRLRDPAGRLVWDSGPRHNLIVLDCRRLLAGFMRGEPTLSLGIQGLRIGAGRPAWDQAPGVPPEDPALDGLYDAHSLLVERAALQLDYLDGETVSVAPTSRLRITARLGPGVPPWPDAHHATGTLREFGLVGRLEGGEVLIDHVVHPAIAKDPASTLERTIWLQF